MQRDHFPLRVSGDQYVPNHAANGFDSVGASATLSRLQPQRANRLSSYPTDGYARHGHLNQNSFAFIDTERRRLADLDAHVNTDSDADASGLSHAVANHAVHPA